MLKHSLKASLAIIGMALLLASTASAAKPVKLNVCHSPPGNPEKTKRIWVGAKGNALPAHMAHGDWLVTEEMCDGIADNNCDRETDQELDDADCAARFGDGATCESGECVLPPGVCPCADLYDQAIDLFEGFGGIADPGSYDECVVAEEDDGNIETASRASYVPEPGPPSSYSLNLFSTRVNDGSYKCTAIVSSFQPFEVISRDDIDIQSEADEIACVALQKRLCEAP